MQKDLHASGGLFFVVDHEFPGDFATWREALLVLKLKGMARKAAKVNSRARAWPWIL